MLDATVESGAVGVFWFGTATPDVPSGTSSIELASVEPYWGVVRPYVTHEPAWDALRALADGH